MTIRPARTGARRVRLAPDGPVHDVFAGRTRCGLALQYAMHLEVVDHTTPTTCRACTRTTDLRKAAA
ncbi:hypothetical protein ACN20G_28010 (plasmid) [Streptomyces sp. BI20]|uniref:hypothetical protein n=1 Tax=Streptomyces sp. BI20 TaxID=3403460 RepID=UPI003C74A830